MSNEVGRRTFLASLGIFAASTKILGVDLLVTERPTAAPSMLRLATSDWRESGKVPQDPQVGTCFMVEDDSILACVGFHEGKPVWSRVVSNMEASQ